VIALAVFGALATAAGAVLTAAWALIGGFGPGDPA